MFSNYFPKDSMEIGSEDFSKAGSNKFSEMIFSKDFSDNLKEHSYSNYLST